MSHSDVPSEADPIGLKLTYLKGTELFQDFAPEQLESLKTGAIVGPVV